MLVQFWVEAQAESQKYDNIICATEIAWTKFANVINSLLCKHKIRSAAVLSEMASIGRIGDQIFYETR